MRHPFISLGITLLAALAAPAVHGFEIERETLYEATNPQRELKIISTADDDLFAPVVLAFQADNPGVSVRYTVVSSTELMAAIEVEGVPFDIALSSAMDLQTKLANDGFTQPYRSAATDSLPDWAKWRDHVFSFTREPATIVVSTAAFQGLEVPKTRQGLIALLRDNQDRFQGRVGTYDVRQSGLGYLFATQDSRSSETYWRLTEIMGRLGTKLYCCSSEMIRDVSDGRIALAYNVLGSYAEARKAQGDNIEIILPEDFATVMLRTMVIPANAENPSDAGRFIDYLVTLSENGGGPRPFPPIEPAAKNDSALPRPIRLGPGLLVFLDALKRQRFLRAWEDAVEQE